MGTGCLGGLNGRDETILIMETVDTVLAQGRGDA